MRDRLVAILGTTLAAVVVLAGLLVAEEKEAGRAYGVAVGIGVGAAARGSWLGVVLLDITAEKARELKAPGEYGAVVTQVEEDSPAAKAGVMKDDVIIDFAGERVWSVAHLRRLLRDTPPGRAVAMQVSRGGQKKTVEVKLEPARRASWFARRLPEPPWHFEIHPPEFDIPFPPSAARLGISADDLTPQLAEYFGVKQAKGVLVREVTAGSAAEKAGMKAGDVIISVDEKEVGTVRELRRALPRPQDEKRTVTLTIVRERREQKLAVELEPRLPPQPVRHAEAWIDSYDPEEVEELAAEEATAMQRRAEEIQRRLQQKGQHLRQHVVAQVQRRAAELQRQASELGQRVREKVQRMPQEWQRLWEDRQRELERQIHGDLEPGRQQRREFTTI